MNPPLLRWLHLTDLHVGKVSEQQGVALRSLFDTIVNESKDTPYDLVILTGDLVYSGLKEEFQRLQELLITPLQSHSLFSSAKFFAVPGNHDLNCDIGNPVIWGGIGVKRQESFFNDDTLGVSIRDQRSKAFSAYSEFVRTANIVSVDPLHTTGVATEVDVRGRKFTLISLVTALFSDKDVPDKNKAPMPVHPTRRILQQVDEDSIILIIGHHPYSWFLTDSSNHFHTLLIENNALYLHGHEHIATPKFGNRGLISLGLGAAYQSGLDVETKSYYRNSFAICEIAEELHVAVTSWDSEHGIWRPDQNLPPDFRDQSERLPNGYRLLLPSTKLASQLSPLSGLALAVRTEIQIERCLWLATDGTKRWTEILIALSYLSMGAESFKIGNQSLPTGHVQFRVKDSEGIHLIYAISGHGDVLNFEQIQKLNTEFDTQDYDDCKIITLGSLAREAQTLATKLGQKKPFVCLTKDDMYKKLSAAILNNSSQPLKDLDINKTTISLIVTDRGLGVLLEDRTRNEWFSVIDEGGKQAAESSELVVKLISVNPHLEHLSYKYTRELEAGPCIDNDVSFDKAEYLSRNLEYFDDVKYAPLAALGLKFKSTSLSDMYVAASADVGGSTKSNQNATRALSEMVESLNMTKVQKEQLEAQLRDRLGLNKTAEVGAASHLYQRFNNIVVLGDPGSGKTCFLKNEILSYCKANDQESWYSNHLPVYLSLAEAANLCDETNDILDICQIQSSRRRIDLPKSAIEKALSAGQVAFFFDGLDEVGFINKRIALMSKIGNLVKTHASKGNRFVLASRPAAVQPVDIPEAFTYVQLKGLTEDEIRVLAGKVISARLGDEHSELGEEKELIERLLQDTRDSPGIARIARNPLLLTLLVLIYANTGSLSAKRHLIYTQAIKTLVSVRGREFREQHISEADLRTRLGALAVGIFTREINEIPKRAEVVSTLTPIIEKARKKPIDSESGEVNKFIQEVAEATGLISIHPSAISSSDDLITFMHFSFLEYYTAAGFLSKNHDEVLTRLSRNPRWKDVTTLMFGILSDHSDVTPQLKILIEDESDAGQITKYKLLLGIDCASECDVPPEGVQDLIGDEIFATLSCGAGKYSANIRSEIADRLKHFLQGTGPRMEDALVRGLNDSDPITCAAFCDLISRLDSSVRLSQKIIESFTNCLKNDNPVLQTAALAAIESHAELRNDSADITIRKSLKGSVAEKHAALKVISSVPEYILKNIREVRSLLDDPNPLLSDLAAHCLIADPANFSYLQDDEHLREKILSKINQTDQENFSSKTGVSIDQGTIESMIHSADITTVELAIRYVPMLQNDDSYIHKILSKTLRSSSNSRIQSAAIDSLRVCPNALALITLADTDYICKLLNAKERNVRLAAIKLLGNVPDDEEVILSLKNLLKNLAESASRTDEISSTARSLVKHTRKNPLLKREILDLVVSYLPKSLDQGFGDANRQHHIRELLYVCEIINLPDNSIALKILDFAKSFKTPEKLRAQYMRVFGCMAEPSSENAKTICDLIVAGNPMVKDSVYAASLSFIDRCKTKVEYVRKVNGALDEIRSCLCKAWWKEVRTINDSISPAGITDIRKGILEIENLTAAYEEYADRIEVKSVAQAD